MPSFNTIIQVAAVTITTMFVVNTMAAQNPTLRRIIRGRKGIVTGVPVGSANAGILV